MGHGWEGAVLKLMRGKDFTFTVTGADQVTGHYRRIHLTDGGMLAATGTHPTMWVRVWFTGRDGKPHQRAFTLVDPNPERGTFSLEFALHDGVASDWARAAQPGDRIEATVQGTGFTSPEPAPERLLLVGDPASLPALNSLLDAHPRLPATLWFETPNAEEDHGLPLRVDPARHDVRRVPRREDGAHLVEEVRRELPKLLPDDRSAAYVWIACDARTTRALTAFARKEMGIPKQRVNALGYWQP